MMCLLRSISSAPVFRICGKGEIVHSYCCCCREAVEEGIWLEQHLLPLMLLPAHRVCAGTIDLPQHMNTLKLEGCGCEG